VIHILKGKAGDPHWGLQMLFKDLHDYYNRTPPEQPPQRVQQPQQSSAPPQQISNIVNYPPQAVPQTTFRFASIYTIVITVTLLVIAFTLLWKTGALDYLVQMFYNLTGV